MDNKPLNVCEFFDEEGYKAYCRYISSGHDGTNVAFNLFEAMKAGYCVGSRSDRFRTYVFPFSDTSKSFDFLMQTVRQIEKTHNIFFVASYSHTRGRKKLYKEHGDSLEWAELHEKIPFYQGCEILCLGKTPLDGAIYIDFDRDEGAFNVQLLGYDCPEIQRQADFFMPLVEECRDLSKEEEKNKNKFYIFSVSPNGSISISPIDMPRFDFVPTNYTKEVREGYDYILEETGKNNPNGRIVLVSGPPGTGKTYLVRSFITDAKDCAVIIVPNTMISGLESPQLLTTLVGFRNDYLYEGEKIVFVVEDADLALGSREERVGDVLSVTSILNLTDGIVGDSLGARVIATTNLSDVKFDDAIMRPGRLLKHMVVNPLSAEEAGEAYKHITGKEMKFDKPTTLATVYANVNECTEHIIEKKVFKAKKPMGFGV